MKTTIIGVGALLLAGLLHLCASGMTGIHLAGLFDGHDLSFREIVFVHASLPRVVMAGLVGLGLGLAGALLQELTQNRLVAPTTLGTASGAWLAMVLAKLFAPALLAQIGVGIPFIGGLLATFTVLAAAGLRGMNGLSIVIIGFAMNLLLGGFALLLVLINTSDARGLFIWGAGDLTQTGWSQVIWLAPQIVIATLCTIPFARALMLMRLGADQAARRGLSVASIMVAVVVFAVWMTAAAISAVGLIGFIGLLAPNIARGMGARKTLDILVFSMIFGAVALVGVDIVPVVLSDWTKELLPSGTAAAFIGAPAMALLAFAHKTIPAQGFSGLKGMPRSRLPWIFAALGCVLCCVIVAALLITKTENGFAIGTGSAQLFGFRWPRVMIAAGAGVAIALSGLILQRLLRNPLASPDIIGITSGATLSVVAAVVWLGLPLSSAALPAALAGAVVAIAILALFSRNGRIGVHLMILLGISVAATLDATVQLVMARGGDSGYVLLGWLAGSMARVTAGQAIMTCCIAGGAFVYLCRFDRTLTLLSMTEIAATGRGVYVNRARMMYLVLAGLLAATVTAFVGPITFIGLLAPHLARLLGAVNLRSQVMLSAIIGAILLILSDHLGRMVLYPFVLPAGALASMLGGLYLLVLLSFQSKRHR